MGKPTDPYTPTEAAMLALGVFAGRAGLAAGETDPVELVGRFLAALRAGIEEQWGTSGPIWDDCVSAMRRHQDDGREGGSGA